MARTRWPPGPVNPGLWHRPGRSDRQRRWVPKNWARPTGRSQDNPSGVGRFGGQTGPSTRPYAHITAERRKQGRSTYPHPPCRLCAGHRPSARGHWHAQMRHFGAFPGWPTAVRMIAVGYRYLSPVPGMSVEVRVPAEGICGDRQGKGADGFVGQAGIRGAVHPLGVGFPHSIDDSAFRHRPDGKYPARGESREQAE